MIGLFLYYRSTCSCWKTLVSDSAMAADVTEQFIRLMSTTPLLNEEHIYKDRPRIAALMPLAVSKSIVQYLVYLWVHIFKLTLIIGNT